LEAAVYAQLEPRKQADSGQRVWLQADSGQRVWLQPDYEDLLGNLRIRFSPHYANVHNEGPSNIHDIYSGLEPSIKYGTSSPS
jgi:hypothetical protein